MKALLFLVAPVALLATPANAKTPSSFLHDAIQGDNSEMTLGALAATRGDSAGTRTFGRTLRADHAKAKMDAVALARRDRVAIPSDMMPEARTEYRKLQRMSGPAFDREFARYMVDDHRKDIAEFEDQARTGTRGTAALARATLPDLRKHLRMAEALVR
ncbi:DUF4142 domain-containing protein [Sphingomonas sp.]|jgi:putative membrane protein|uniref:DUF4142 domain-containing protein n=1 Tax=Sphingomonas sp. TaxID=28214 RepID=UPI002E338231|nr:DUF4142 domain-containing protein [Sphingomonas sp.]HEX4693657.1 DUF4142 domain-containing protein [Sphingomonas sp.]